ncbi:hypothetical protein J5N97_002159 [Dioscorea zingiberensis]|uniref:G protein gamma domain-containing protein n=1 Tax=Dioscorea zingiberensis TaxID=325984 RepID=A0A9D5D2B0_9LILI|nr:hypothetical protein J5N97_002159 [Dioscorea zingiberensis]
MAAGGVAVAPAPSPKSPPRYPDLCGRRRLQLEAQILNREIGFLEDELQALDGLQAVSRCCKEVNEFVGTKPDPLLPLNKKRRRSCRIWKWIRKNFCCNFSWLCCSSSCLPQLELPSCSCLCPKNCTCCRCKYRFLVAILVKAAFHVAANLKVLKDHVAVHLSAWRFHVAVSFVAAKFHAVRFQAAGLHAERAHAAGLAVLNVL